MDGPLTPSPPAPVPGRARILHAIAHLDPRGGGVPVVCAQLAAAQVAYGHEVSVLTEAVAAGFDLSPVKISAVGKTSAVGAWTGRPGRAISDAVAGADLVHLHGVWDAVLIAAAAAARARGVPYVVHPHGMLDPWSLAQKKWKKWVALWLGVRKMLDRAAAVRVLNRDEDDLIRPLGLASPVRVIPNGMNLADVDPPATADAFRRAVPAVGDRRYLLFLSRLHYKKGLDVLGEAFAQLAPKFPDVQLVVAGADDGYEAEFRRWVGSSGLADRIHLTGPLYGPAKWSALANAACFCLPSRQEGFSIAILEALASRRPVVITDACHFPEVGEVGAGAVVPLSAAAVADGVARVLSDSTAPAAMGAAGRRLVEERFTRARVAAMCEELDREILGSRKSP